MIVAVGYAWAALIAAFGLTNLIIALFFGLNTWAWFVSVGAIGAKALQYAVFRTIVRTSAPATPVEHIRQTESLVTSMSG